MPKKNGTMKLGTLINAEPALSSLMGQKLKAKASFRILKVLGQVQPHLDNFRKIQNELLEKHGKEDNGSYKIEPESKSWDTYVSELQSLMDEEVDVSVKKLPLNMFTTVELTVQEAASLDWLVEN